MSDSDESPYSGSESEVRDCVKVFCETPLARFSANRYQYLQHKQGFHGLMCLETLQMSLGARLSS